MQLRHRIPTIFSIYMVDVLCCALGCVVLLWQVNFSEAEKQTKAAENALRDLLKVSGEKDSITGKYTSVKEILSELTKNLEDKERLTRLLRLKLEESDKSAAMLTVNLDNVRLELDQTKTKLDDSEKLKAEISVQLAQTKTKLDETERKKLEIIQDLDKERKLALVYRSDYERKAQAEAQLEALLANLRSKHDDLVKKSGTDTVEKTRLISDLSSKELAARLRLAVLEKDLKDARIEIITNTRKVKDQDASLQDAEARYQAIEKQLAALRVQEKENLARISDSSAAVKTLKGDLASTRTRLDEQQKLAVVFKNDYDRAKQAEARLETLLASLQLQYDDLAKKARTDLADKARSYSELSEKEVAARLRLAALEKDLKDARIDIGLHKNSAKEKDISLQEAEARYLAIEKQLAALRLQERENVVRIGDTTAAVKLLKDDLSSTRSKLDEQQKLAVVYRNDYDRAKQAEARLANNLTISSKQLDEYKAANQQLKSRFAGMTLTGSRVIFLVDMSGSMEMVDENTLDPDKWPIVSDTVGKIMASLPDLRQYQVIMFSDKVRYPLGKEGRWLDYHGGQDAKDAVKAIRAIKPRDGTHMSAAFGEVFKYRPLGLDTVYFFSDGLPNMGGGLPTDAKQLEKLDEQARNNLCSKYIRHQLKTVWNPKNSPARVRINTVGFFFESPDVGAFLWALAREYDGSFVGMSKP